MRLINYCFWGIGYLYLLCEISLWWLLALPLWLLLYVVCDKWLENKERIINGNIK